MGLIKFLNFGGKFEATAVTADILRLPSKNVCRPPVQWFETLPAVSYGFSSNPGEGMGICKCMVPVCRGDTLNSRRATSTLNFRRDLTLHSAKLEIKRIFRESFRLTASRVARDKPWSTLCKKSHGIPSSPRAAAVAKFRLLTGQDCLCAHLFRFNLVT
ncbi:hypothetical protein TNCV_4801881 [Trichonephila clavipes]|nr:hypothetical protein TNCV_4801881 [Trichonephila clavipes]